MGRPLEDISAAFGREGSSFRCFASFASPFVAASVAPKNINPESSKRSSRSFSAEDSATTITIVAIRERILQQSIRNIATCGWTLEAIAQATVQVVSSASERTQGNTPSMALMGLVTLPQITQYLILHWNERLYREIDELRQSKDVAAWSNKSRTDRILWCFQRRLQYVCDSEIPLNLWSTGMAYGLHPDVAVSTQAQLSNMLDRILLAAAANDHGPAVTTVERLGYAALYAAAELHLLTDTSPQHQDTWTFLESHIRTASGVASLVPSSLVDLPSQVLQHHSPADLAFTASIFGKAVVSGLYSLIMPPTSQSTPPSSNLRT
jgi:COQ9